MGFSREEAGKTTNKTKQDEKLVESQLPAGLAVDPSSDDDAQLLKRAQW